MLVFGFGLSATSASAEVVCQPAEQQLYLKGVAWDIETETARLKIFDSTVHSGRIVYSRPHNEFGDKINIIIPIEPDEVFKRDHVELIAFPTNDTGNYRLMGAAFITINGERLIDHLIGTAEYSCLEM